MKVEEKSNRPSSWQPKQLFVSGIPYDTTNEQLLDFFSDEKESIRDVKMPVFQDSGRCMGYAHVTFTSKDAYESAKTKSGQRLGGRYLDIKEAQGTTKIEPAQSQGKTICHKLMLFVVSRNGQPDAL